MLKSANHLIFSYDFSYHIWQLSYSWLGFQWVLPTCCCGHFWSHYGLVQGVKSRGVLMLFGLQQFEITEMLSFFETNSLVQSMSLKKLNLNRGDVLKLNTNAFIFPIMNDILNLSYAFCRWWLSCFLDCYSVFGLCRLCQVSLYPYTLTLRRRGK